MRIRRTAESALCAGLLVARCASAISLDIGDQNSIKSAALTIANGMLNYYTGDELGGTPGVLPEPYYWWEAGAMFGTLIDYWYYTGDDQFNNMTSTALQFQTGPDNNFMPPNQTKSLGNDDQGFWGLAAMSAAEVKFPNPTSDKPQWLALAQGVFNSQAPRWDNLTCGGGLKWQIFAFNAGYNYKNSISNGCFFNLGARLGFYTQNQTYFDWAERSWTWSASVGLLTDTPQGIAVYDGTDDDINCTQLNHQQWSYNSGVFLLGAAVMWNQTTGDAQQRWESRVRRLVKGSSVFFRDNVMFEDCESGVCDTDQLSFKAYLSRWMAASIKVAPFVEDLVSSQLKASAQAAAKNCNGGSDGVTCGTKWTTNTWDGQYGVGQQMSALEVIQGLLIDSVSGPVGNQTGGISIGNPSAGTGGDRTPGAPPGIINTADRAGAGILTAVILIAWMGGAYWMVS